MLELITRRERFDLFIAWLGITIAFTLAIVLSSFNGKIDPRSSCISLGYPA